MELRGGLPLLLQQFQALFWKNLLLSRRNKRAIFVQVFSSFLFIFLIFCIQKTTESGKAFADDPDPKPLTSLPIPPCEEKHYIRSPCYDFVWSGNSSSKIETIVSRIMANNPGRPIPPSKVKSFKISSEVDEWLFNNPLRCPGALHFVERGDSVINYGIQTNSTAKSRRGIFEDPTLKFQIPLQIAAEREIARYLIGDPNFSWLISLKSFAHPGLKKYNAVGTIGPTFFLAIALFSFVFQMSSVVTEKELKLRQAMTMMGLYDTAYWLSWLTWEAIIVFVTSLLTVLFGMMFKFDFFLYNSFAVSFYLFFLFQLNMIGFAFMLSTFVSKSSTSTTLGFSIFIISFITRIVSLFGYPYSIGYSRLSRFIWSLFPPNIFSKGLQILVDATSTHEKAGMSWSQTAKCLEKDPMCVVTMSDIYKWLLSEFYLWLLLTIYFDNIMPTPSGMRKSVFYFLNPGYWTGNEGNKLKDGSVCSCATPGPPVEHVAPDDKDVLEEESIVKQQAKEGVDPNVAVQIRGLVKTYPGNLKISCCCCCCCKCKRTSAFHAVKGLWLNFAKDQLFCLLGPNGAGKTTTISCLTGIATVTGGDALVYGYSIRSSVGMANIRKMMGVCPQFDILWDALSGEEHLHLFASIKGLPPSSIRSIAEKSLAEVKLAKAARMRAGNYSGGMKRRLSIAIALIGDPKLVILDEPTTGIDPITRRHVWDIIEDAKKGRAIVLTTHSMEEADVLGDRIGIMAKGRLRCIGTSIRLKSRFGNGFIVNINFSGSTKVTPSGEDTAITAQQKAVKQFFKYHLDVVPKEENKSFQTFVIPQAKEGLLTEFFLELQGRQEEFGIADIQLSLTTLEEVFLNIARQAELESAAADGRVETVTLTSGESLEVPLGARFVGIPGTESAEHPRGFMVEVFWEQDESGSLCISGHSPETPIPPHVLLTVPLTATMKGDTLGSAVPLRGFVIDPKEFG